MSGFMYRVLAFKLVSMPAYENIGLELPSDGLWPDWGSLHEWMKLQLPAELLYQWDAHWAFPRQEAKQKDVTKACGRIKALLAECIAGRLASIDAVTVQRSLAL